MIMNKNIFPKNQITKCNFRVNNPNVNDLEWERVIHRIASNRLNLTSVEEETIKQISNRF